MFCLGESLLLLITKRIQSISEPYNLFAVLVIVFMQNMILNYSGLQTFETLGMQSIVATVFNTMVILSVNLLFAILIRNWKVIMWSSFTAVRSISVNLQMQKQQRT